MENATEELIETTVASSSVEIGAEAQFGVAPSAEIESAERVAVDLFLRLESARVEIGLKFGEALIVLRDLRKESGDWMAYLESLGITYEAARYWMAKAKGEKTDRHKKPVGPAKAPPQLDWDQATDQFTQLIDKIEILRHSKPLDKGIVVPLMRMADILGYEVKTKGGTNHEEDLLQRKQQGSSGLAQATDDGRADREGGRR
jgi:hypothetical protein